MEDTSDDNSSVADNETVEEEHSQEEKFEIAEEKTVEQESPVSRPHLTSANKIIWRYYKRLLPLSDKTAKCKLCHQIKSYRTTVTNLKMHIWLKHPEIERQEPALARRKKKRTVKPKSQSDDNDTDDDVKIESGEGVENDNRDYKPEQNSTPRKSNTYKRQRTSKCYVWKYFRAMEPLEDKMARCNFCRNMFSYKTTVTNLKTHLGIKHADLVKDDVQFNSERLSKWRKKAEKGIWEYLEIDTDDNDDRGAQQNDATDETVKFTSEIWKQYNHDDDEPTCNLCRDMVPNSIEEMKNHLEERHSILLDQIMQKVLDAVSGDETDLDEENTYTEIVYLEDEQNTVPNKPSPKKKRKTRVRLEDIRPLPKVAETNVSESSDEAVLIRKSDTPPPLDDLDVYLKYVKVLLQKVPEESAQKLHLDIINLIMNATQQHKNIIIEAMNLNTTPNTGGLTTVLDKGTNLLLNQNRNGVDNTRRYISVPVQKLVTENEPKNIPVPQLVMISANNNVSRSIYNNPSTIQ